ncbi:MAG TPA: translocation/assembly module TamB domain-containing protein [Candidatus Eisenbacteria bacterium]|nr:translocation/assembly module TamB domain-containing protein [Candidatus Eisenbacteria bacterium]
MKRSRRILLAVTSVAILAILAAAGGWWVLYTEPGARWGFERLGGLLPGKLDVRELRGPLHGPLIAHDFTYRDERIEITAERIEVDWELRELLRRQWDIHRLRADNVRVLLGASGDTPAERDSLRGALPDLNLPVNIIVRDGLLTNLSLTTPGNDSSLVIDRVAVRARSLRGDSLHVDHFLVSSRALDVDFSGVALPRGAYPLALRGSWAFRPAGRPEIVGTGTVAGTLDTLRVVQAVSSPAALHVDMRLFHPLRDLRYQGDVRFTDLVPRRIDAAWPEGRFSGDVTLEGTMDELASQGTVRGAVEALGGAAVADFRVRRDRTLWHLDHLLVTRPGMPGRLTAHGTVAADTNATRFELRTEWAALGWPLTGEPLVTSERGTATLEGSPREFDLDLRALLAGRNLPPGTWTLDGRGTRGRLQVRTVIADLLDGTITGTGSVAWEPGIRWDLRFEGTGIDPGSVWPAYPGSLAFAGESQGTHGPAGPSGRILVSRLDGTLRGQPVAGIGTITARSGQYAMEAASLQYGPNRVEANGGFGRSWSLDWRLMAPKLGAAFPQASGSVDAQGSVRGSGRRPRVTASVTGDSLFFGRAYARVLRAEADVDLAPGGPVRIDALATQAGLGASTADRVSLRGTGTREQHELRAAVATRADSTVAVLAGGFQGDAWRGLLRSFDLVHPRAGTWALASPAPLEWDEGRVALSGFEWRSGVSRLTLEADWSPRGPWSLDSRVEQVDLALLEPAFPPRLRLQGFLGGHATASRGEDGRIFADVDLTPGPGIILHHTATGQWVPTRFENARLRVVTDGSRVSSTVAADLVNTGTVRGALGMPARAMADPSDVPLDGSLNVHLTNLAVLQGFTFELGSTAGALDADLRIAGTLQRPSLYGPVSVRNGSANLPRFGLAIRELNARAVGNENGRLDVSGSMRSGPGTMTFDGTAALGASGKPMARLTLRGDRFQAMNTDEMEFLASPDLQVALDGNRLNVTGQVTLPEGEIEVGQEDKRGVVRPSEDVTYTESDTLETGPLEIHSSIRVILGKNVVVRGFGLEVKPSGSVLAVEEPGLPMLGTGQFEIEDGTYTIYGQALEVENGSLIFGGGPITNPAVRARASRRVGSVVAGFDVRGTVMRPDVRLFSEPPMGQSEALSYILFGKPIERGYLSEGQIASTLATTLGVPGTNLLAQGVASEIGIEQAQIQVGNSLEETSVRLGTRISPRLYVSYGMDVFEAESSIQLRYILNRVFTIEAETADQNRVDVLYTIEP